MQFNESEFDVVRRQHENIHDVQIDACHPAVHRQLRVED
jgi:hypothetical protein